MLAPKGGWRVKIEKWRYSARATKVARASQILVNIQYRNYPNLII